MAFHLPLKIAGVGRYLPKRVVPNSELEAKCGLEEGWIKKRQGVSERRWIEDETASFMGVEAAREAIADAKMTLGDIDLILNASGTPEQCIPDGAPLIQRQLGLGESGVACMSIHTTCLSFLVAVDISSGFLALGRYRNILIVSSDISSCALNFSNPESCTLFGDAAAAAVVTRTPEDEASCVEAAMFETYGEGAYYSQIPGGGTRNHPNRDGASPEDNIFHMDGLKVLKFTLKYAAQSLEKLRPGLSSGLSDIDLVVPHQASKIALDALTLLGMPEEKVVRTIDRFGNCVAASLPVTLYEAVKTKRLKRGNRLLLVGAGAGISIGGIILVY
ncbi:MAG: 3-oxoacyl-[acyl-carrier-protein] synthase III C-terminal domain-containing protein [Planctomycetota bacterium]|jgi:3-oxoacyl-[acyl-carrier-protein] synthase-3